MMEVCISRAEENIGHQANATQLVFAQSIFYHLSVNLVKASFVLQYTRLFNICPSIMFACHTILVTILGATAWGVFGVIFLCNPVRKYWDMTAVGTCMDAETHFWSTSIMGIILDWMIWILPMPVVGKLKLPRRQKLGLLVVFGLGGLCVSNSVWTKPGRCKLTDTGFVL